MQLICPSCFSRPAAAPDGKVPDMMVCSTAPVMRPSMPATALAALPRCHECGREVWLERPHLAWYGV